jgi:hypothetical protein
LSNGNGRPRHEARNARQRRFSDCADNVRIAAEDTLPQPMAEDDDFRSAWTIVVDLDRPANQRPHAEQRKERPAHALADDSQRHFGTSHCERPVRGRRQIAKSDLPAGKILIVRYDVPNSSALRHAARRAAISCGRSKGSGRNSTRTTLKMAVLGQTPGRVCDNDQRDDRRAAERPCSLPGFRAGPRADGSQACGPSAVRRQASCDRIACPCASAQRGMARDDDRRRRRPSRIAGDGIGERSIRDAVEQAGSRPFIRRSSLGRLETCHKFNRARRDSLVRQRGFGHAVTAFRAPASFGRRRGRYDDSRPFFSRRSSVM